MTIKEEISKVLEVWIGNNTIKDAMLHSDKLGQMNQRKLIDIIAVLCDRIDQLENKDHVRAEAATTKGAI